MRVIPSGDAEANGKLAPMPPHDAKKRRMSPLSIITPGRRARRWLLGLAQTVVARLIFDMAKLTTIWVRHRLVG